MHKFVCVCTNLCACACMGGWVCAVEYVNTHVYGMCGCKFPSAPPVANVMDIKMLKETNICQVHSTFLVYPCCRSSLPGRIQSCLCMPLNLFLFQDSFASVCAVLRLNCNWSHTNAYETIKFAKPTLQVLLDCGGH